MPSNDRIGKTARARELGGRLVHIGVLAFTAWWLIATSAPPGALDCFTGIGATARLAVSVGAAEAPADASAPTISCGALDGIAPGSVLSFDLAERRRQSELGGCHGYDSSAIAGLTDVAVDPKTAMGAWDGVGLTRASGTFSSTTRISCRASWRLSLLPETPLTAGQLISPLDAAVGQRWFLERSMLIAQAQFCDGAFATAGEVSCSDTFTVDAIVEAPAP